LENKVARASTMLVNGAEELRGHLGKARTTLSRAGDERPSLRADESSADPTSLPDPIDRPRLVGMPP
jgi:hypothetical protein